jgi:hypothetical protein
MIAKPAYPYLCRDSDRHGRWRIRYRLRIPGRKAVTIKGSSAQANLQRTTELRWKAIHRNRFASLESPEPRPASEFPITRWTGEKRIPCRIKGLP